MSALAAMTDKFKGQVQVAINLVRSRLFGANNERLDFIMDSFYKLSPPQRSGVLAGVVAVIALFVLGAVGLYFTQVNNLKNDLSNSFAVLHELQALTKAYEVENKNFDKLVDIVGRKTRDMKPKPFFEKIANDLGVTIEGLNEQRIPLGSDNPLGNRMQEVVVEMRLPNISIPRLMNFLIEVEKANKYLRVEDLQIRGRFGTKLYFDAQAKIRGYGMI